MNRIEDNRINVTQTLTLGGDSREGDVARDSLSLDVNNTAPNLLPFTCVNVCAFSPSKVSRQASMAL